MLRIMHQYRKRQEIIRGKEYVFDSGLEYQIAQYLQILVDQGSLQRWIFHPIRWDFWEFGYRNKPYEYSPDFWTKENDGTEVYIEAKGRIQTYDLSRIRRANKHYGPLLFDLYMQNMPRRRKFVPGKRCKKTASQIIAQAEYNMKCIRRVVDFSQILKQCKGMIEK